MKKSILSIALIGTVSVFAQQPVMLKKTNLNTKAPAPATNVDYSFYDMVTTATQPVRSHNNPVSAAAVTETVIANTLYPLQTNRATMNRCIYNADGTILAGLTIAQGSWNSWPDRGTGYNYHDGTSWTGGVATARIETDRTGFGDLAVLGNNSEMVVAHNTNQNNAMHFSTRAVKGTGSWTENYNLQPAMGYGYSSGRLWGRIAVSGTSGNIVHQISLTTPTNASPPGAIYRGQDGALVYSRSTDGGATWSVPDVLALIDSSQYVKFSADEYAIDAKGSTVCIVIGDLVTDVILLKSTDDGATWTKTRVNQFPLPLYSSGLTDVNGDNVADTIDTSDETVEVLVDNSGQAHVWYGFMRTINTSGSADSVSYFPGSAALMYWNESMGSGAPVNIAGALDYNANGTLDVTDWGTYGTGLLSTPSAGIDANGYLYVAYSCILESTDNGSGKSYRTIYMIGSSDGGQTWTAPYLLGTDPNNFDYFERCYPSVARNVAGGTVRLIYQRDAQPGHGVGAGNPDEGDNSGGLNEIVYVEIPANTIIGVQENTANINNVNLFPNPTADNVVMTVSLEKAAAYNVTVSNLLGQNLVSFQQQLNTGANRVDLNTASLAPGIYFVTVGSGAAKVTTKLVKE